jgi:hypothetical protein
VVSLSITNDTNKSPLVVLSLCSKMSLKGLTFFIYYVDNKKKKEVSDFVTKNSGSVAFAVSKNVSINATTTIT